MKCPAGRRMPEPCPLKCQDCCTSCLDDWQERASIIADGFRLPKPQAEAEATEQLREALARAEHAQGRLF